jgi:hypothetical protein
MWRENRAAARNLNVGVHENLYALSEIEVEVDMEVLTIPTGNQNGGKH